MWYSLDMVFVLKAIELLANIVFGLFALFWILIIVSHLMGWPLYLFDKMLKSHFGLDVLLPFKILFHKVCGSSGSGSPDVRQ